ncbi:MAG: putative 2-hydroxyglutaryl-CoA dehydratase, partial [Streblomastix strix]
MFQEMYRNIPKDAYIAHALATGYGEHIVKAAFCTDSGLVETVCHLRAARFFQPEVDFVLDIGGQDMKSIHVDQGGVISQICLNEACSSGCGSFIQTLSATLNLPVNQFSAAGLKSTSPVDLGSRCTVFMNSRIKQAQKDCASVEDISAGLALSIIRNALFKVIRVHDPKDIGNKIVVQGGTFLNDSILRSAEIIFGNEVIRPDIAGHMGAFGAALIGIERWEQENESESEENDQGSEMNIDQLKNKNKRSQILDAEGIDKLTWETESRRCGKCINNCQLTVHKFSHNNGIEHVSGNRCERGLPLEQQTKSKEMIDMVDWYRKRVFSPKLYTPLLPKDAKRGTIGFPRALFFWEEYPLWFTAFTKLGFRVILSAESTEKLHLKGMETIPSESACFPAKLTHGHVSDLIERKVDAIFIPQELYGRIEAKQAIEHYNCSLLATYGAMINNSFDFAELGIKYFTPALP